MRQRGRLLAVDPDAAIRAVVADLLLGRGLGVRGAADVDAALYALRAEPFEALLCPLSMLRARDGILGSVARKLHPELRIVAMSALGDRAQPGEAHASLAKPFTRVQLIGALRPCG